MYPMNSHCAEDKQNNLEANDIFLTKTMRRNITVKMLERRKLRARSTAPVVKSCRERQARLLQWRHLQWRTRNQRQVEENR